jgi:hypothetical protein
MYATEIPSEIGECRGLRFEDVAQERERSEVRYRQQARLYTK